MINDTLYILVEQFMGWMLLFVGTSVLVRPMVWANFGRSIYNMDEAGINRLAIITTTCFLPMGLLVVLTHNDWSGFSVPSLIVTILGWTIIIKSLLFFFLPVTMLKLQEVIYKNKSDQFLNWFFRGIGVIYIAVSLLIICQN